MTDQHPKKKPGQPEPELPTLPPEIQPSPEEPPARPLPEVEPFEQPQKEEPPPPEITPTE